MTKKLISATAFAAVVALAGTSSSLGGPFEKMDTDGDGSVSKAEFTAFRTEKGDEADKIEKWFAKKDADSDGKLSKDEVESGKKGGKKGDKEAADEE